MAQISVDGDTSTNDTVIGLASGAAGNAKIADLESPEAKQLEDAVTALLQASTLSWLQALTSGSSPLAPSASLVAAQPYRTLLRQSLLCDLDSDAWARCKLYHASAYPA